MPIIEDPKAAQTIMPTYGPLHSVTAPGNNDYNGVAMPGCIAVAMDTGKLYSNTGTLAATVWTIAN